MSETPSEDSDARGQESAAEPPASTYQPSAPADPLQRRPPWPIGDFASVRDGYGADPLPEVEARPERVRRDVREGERWSEDVVLTDDGSAFRPEEIITTGGARAWQYLSIRVDGPVDQRSKDWKPRLARLPDSGGRLRVRIKGLTDPRPLVAELTVEGFVSQVNHVYFATCSCGCCPPHPSLVGCGTGGASATPVHATPVHATPVHATPVHATPVHATPVHATPVHATGAPWGRSTAAVVADDDDEVTELAGRLGIDDPPAGGGRHITPVGPTVLVLDTGTATDAVVPAALGHVAFGPLNETLDIPDSDGDDRLDTVAGHGTFIAGLIRSIEPTAAISVRSVIPPQGDLDDAHIVDLIDELVDRIDASQADAEATVPVQILSLSFCGYSEDFPSVFAESLALLQARGVLVVASAGNDADCRPTYPASLPGVISVGAIGPAGPAPFTNYGPWVRACAPGVGLVSTFFDHWDGPAAAATAGGDDPDRYGGWARWSGTSFAAPVVAGVLARHIGVAVTDVGEAKRRAEQAVAAVIDHPALLRIPNLGTVVNHI